jgi:NO-binding membrane sensor protein with MHYT domain
MSNLPPSMFQKDSGEETLWWQKALLLLSVVLKCSALIVAIWCYVVKTRHRSTWYTQLRGISVIVQAVLIAGSSFAWNFLYQDPNGF